MLTTPIQTNVVGLLVIGLIYLQLQKQTGRRLPSQVVFKKLLGVCAALLVLESVMRTLDGNGAVTAWIALLFSAVIYHGLIPWTGLYWVRFVQNRIQKQDQPGSLFRFALTAPVVLNVAAALASIAWPIVFTFDVSAHYRYGPYFFAVPLTLAYYLVIAAGLVLKYRKLIQPRELRPLLLYAILPVAGGVAQIFFGIQLAWVGTALALLFVFLEIENDQIFTDPLTGLANRRRFDNYLEFLYSIGTVELDSASLGGIMIDIDNFRQINDVYGHNLGDRALESVGDILRRSVRRDDLVSRIGGDEFALVLEVGSYENLEKTARRIRENVAEFNRTSTYPFKLSLSLGYDLYDFESGMIPKDFFKRIDDRMYAEKTRNQAQNPAQDQSHDPDQSPMDQDLAVR